MSKLIEYLNENKVGQLATVKDGKPILRPFQFQFVREGKFYFVTSNTKEVYKELKNSREVGFAIIGSDMKWIRINGEVQFVDNLELKEEVLENESMIRSIYKTADNPIFEMFYIQNGQASFHELGGAMIEEVSI